VLLVLLELPPLELLLEGTAARVLALTVLE
jgi:hypothetical protein